MLVRMSTCFLLAATLLATDLSAQGNIGPSGFTADLQAHLDASKGLSPIDVGALIQPGEESEALSYYTGISTKLNFDFANSSLDSFLAHMGYAEPDLVRGRIVFKGLTASDLERLDSFLLMPRNSAEFGLLADAVEDPVVFRALLSLSDFQDDAVLVSRFFAPKIATYYDPADPFPPIDRDKIVPGWRKLVRIAPKEGSSADNDGFIAHAYILFNFKKADPDVDPFAGNESGNNQVIIVPQDQTAGDRVFFAVYKSRENEYEVGLFLAADFDLPGHVGVSLPEALDGRYYVPRACAECHGHSRRAQEGQSELKGQPIDPTTNEPTADFENGIYRFAKPNYLDTDQWYDWMEFDFRGVSSSLNDVVFDGGKDTNAASYRRAFDVIRKINQAIAVESLAAEVDPKQPTFQTLAARKWLQLHGASDARKPYSLRSIGEEQWDPSSVEEMKLLRLLNNYCFRCHSSVRYNIFDKAGVRERKGEIAAFLDIPVTDVEGNTLPGNLMPQGRVLEEEDKKEIQRLLTVVFP